MKYLLQCLWALAVLWQQKTITRGNRVLLYRKTLKLFICFLAFTDRGRPWKQTQGAMRCAVLSALYDYETDWIRIESLSDSIYLRLLEKYVDDPKIRIPAQTLFEDDWNGVLTTDGLERGSIAFTFYNAMIGSTWLKAYSAKEITELGRLLQILDDVLDLELDRAAGHTNCLLVDYGRYLAEARNFIESDFFKVLEGNVRAYSQLRERCLKVSNETPTP